VIERPKYFVYTLLAFLIDLCGSLIISAFSAVAVGLNDFQERYFAQAYVDQNVLHTAEAIVLGLMGILSSSMGNKFSQKLVDPKGKAFKNYRDPEYGKWFVLSWFSPIWSSIFHCLMLPFYGIALFIVLIVLSYAYSGIFALLSSSS
jgi:hypothetical protein